MLSDIQTKEYLIRQWVLWAYENRGLTLYFPSMTATRKMQPRLANGLCIGSEEGQELDRVVSMLKEQSKDQYDVFTYYYLAGYSLRDTAKEMGKTDHKWVKHQLELGEQFFELMTLGPQSTRSYSNGATPVA